MAFVVIIIAIILIVAGYRNTQGDLFAALKTDVPSFATWAAAIVALGIVGFIPGLKPVSRGLLALVIIVIFVRNYSQIINGFNQTWNGTGSTSGNQAAPSTSAIDSILNSNGVTSGFGMIPALSGLGFGG